MSLFTEILIQVRMLLNFDEYDDADDDQMDENDNNDNDDNLNDNVLENP